MKKKKEYPVTIRIEYRIKEEEGMLGGVVTHIHYMDTESAKALCCEVLNNPKLEWMDIRNEPTSQG